MVQFDPPLSCTVSVAVPQTLLPGSRLCLHATVSRDEHASLRRDGTKVQVWSDFGTGDWSETSFEEENVVDDVQDDSEPAVDIYLVGGSVESDTGRDSASGSDTVSLVAATPLLPLVGRTVQFTYRLVHASGAVSWLGSMGTNGSISVEMTRGAGLRAEDWHEDAHGVFSWHAPASGSEPVVVAQLGQDAEWRGWAIGKEGPSSFTALSSAVTDRVALALLPKTRPGAYVAYEPILYHTTGQATLSLTDGGEILLQPGAEESILHASLSTQLWRNAVSDKATTLDIRSPHFLGISVAHRDLGGGRIYLLSTSGSTASITLTSGDFTPFISPSASTLALVNSACRTAKFIRSLSPDDVRVAVGPAGGEIIIIPGFVLRNKDEEWNIACLSRETGRHAVSLMDVDHDARLAKLFSSTEYATSESAATEDLFDSNEVTEASPARHPSTAIEAQVLLAVLYMLRLFLGLVATTISRPSSLRPAAESLGNSPPVDSQLNDIKTDVFPMPQTIPSILFEVTGEFSMVVKGEASKLAFSVGGKPLDPNPENIGEGIWLVKGETDNTSAKLLEITLHEHK